VYPIVGDFWGENDEHKRGARAVSSRESENLAGKGKSKTMEQRDESGLVKRLEQLGITVDVSPTVTTLTYEQIYTSGTTFEEALITFLGEALSRYEALRKRSGLTLP
jgi:hypothetical protein